MLCKQMGWKVPAAFSDTGSCVYRRGDATVTSPEYNSRLICWLQLQVEGRIVAKAGVDWSAAVENARLRWIQLKESERDSFNDGVGVEKFIKSCVDEKFKQLEVKVDNTSNHLSHLEVKLDEKLAKLANDITEAVVQSLKSADDVNQKIISRLKRRKIKPSQLRP